MTRLRDFTELSGAERSGKAGQCLFMEQSNRHTLPLIVLAGSCVQYLHGEGRSMERLGISIRVVQQVGVKDIGLWARGSLQTLQCGKSG